MSKIILDLSGDYIVSPTDTSIDNSDHQYLVIRYDNKVPNQEAILALMTDYAMNVHCTNDSLAIKITEALKDIYRSRLNRAKSNIRAILASLNK